ncbi:hypothetical protein M427DRAFT_321588 [Gonapodya prolifera JEL478]|uniref:Uncharacterized protein n=1 Tax=Gonapodya prolifera (strain JEL478) TaxID=1344416 RepID=A0A139AH81_GONPJ|nr:hypothetical protein M427DRAFT_321588 [Gonapodya prolifera JEL478]|eukprot:KXS15773.1 hypothetical protein M427DRAFT_321588 [Gonapodya prolifera JEL478]
MLPSALQTPEYPVARNQTPHPPHRRSGEADLAAASALFSFNKFDPLFIRMPSHPATIHHNPEGAFGLKWFQQGSHPSFGYQRGQDMVVASDERQTGSHNSPMQPQLQNQPPRSSARVSNPITPSATDTTLLTDGRTINQGGQKSNNVKKANRGSKPTIRGRKKRSSAWDSDPSDTELANMEQSLAVKRPDDSQPSSVVSNVPTLATSKVQSSGQNRELHSSP